MIVAQEAWEGGEGRDCSPGDRRMEGWGHPPRVLQEGLPTGNLHAMCLLHQADIDGASILKNLRLISKCNGGTTFAQKHI